MGRIRSTSAAIRAFCSVGLVRGLGRAENPELGLDLACSQLVQEELGRAVQGGRKPERRQLDAVPLQGVQLLGEPGQVLVPASRRRTGGFPGGRAWPPALPASASGVKRHDAPGHQVRAARTGRQRLPWRIVSASPRLEQAQNKQGREHCGSSAHRHRRSKPVIAKPQGGRHVLFAGPTNSRPPNQCGTRSADHLQSQTCRRAARHENRGSGTRKAFHSQEHHADVESTNPSPRGRTGSLLLDPSWPAGRIFNGRRPAPGSRRAIRHVDGRRPRQVKRQAPAHRWRADPARQRHAGAGPLPLEMVGQQARRASRSPGPAAPSSPATRPSAAACLKAASCRPSFTFTTAPGKPPTPRSVQLRRQLLRQGRGRAAGLTAQGRQAARLDHRLATGPISGWKTAHFPWRLEFTATPAARRCSTCPSTSP